MYQIVPGGSEIYVTFALTGMQTLNVPDSDPTKPKFATTILNAFTYAEIHPFTSLDVNVAVTSDKVKGLDYNTTRHRQEALFNLNASALLTSGQPIPSGASVSYSWSATSSNPVVSSTPLEFGGASDTISAFATAPSVCFTTCTVVANVSGTYYAGSNSAECAAIGGPILTTVYRAGSQINYAHDGNDPKNSYYATYYGYSHVNPIPKYAQPTQDFNAGMLLQPDGVTVKWSLPQNTYSPTLANPNKSRYLIQVTAEEAFKDEAPTLSFHFSDASILGDADDDSISTQDAFTNADGSVTWIPHVYKLSGHKPDHLDNDPQNPYPYTDPSTPTGYQNYAGSQVRYRLIDTAGDPMPGVYIQERFTDNNPLNLQVNGISDAWLTRLVALNNLVNAEDGYFQWDHLLRYWNGNTTDYTDHEYFAGTRGVAAGTGGLTLGVFRITFTPGNPDPNAPGNADQARKK